MSGVLVPDDENMIYDTPLHTVSEKVVLHPEVLLWHMRVIAVLVALITVTLGLLGLAWMRFWPVLTRVHNVRTAADMPESPATRGLRERLDNAARGVRERFDRKKKQR
mmetsp:Transcript_12311/g.31070  ORF Transcript_12311/g.31070 Transcript_12311/m.31070 type:complete len:108 (-) Transcript_12311:171-494(-)|eukprot:CAMPEP_0179894662 /NCGR_PEP_ID=MMETSP0982-20121206/35406_1 /TAXON_ID=483367 /ORGANISM="non described non described, Strain CCMP 2436" /LENGTH=107 /DNA_ID=CAMNT_0021791269 /DNA_START=227 /DNA_END=550 /DNA_ORIENTATION=+